MTVGEALAEARYRAGLTVDEVSERTRIREAVIRCIEQDDYEACGGELYVRGYVRAIAGAVGIDAQPLIREYDAGRATSAAPAAHSAAAGGAARAFAEDPAATVADLAPITADFDPFAITPERVTSSPAPAYTHPREPSAWSRRIRGRRWVTGLVVLVVIVLAVAGIAGSHIVSSLSHSPAAHPAAAAQPTRTKAGTPSPTPSATPTPTPTPTPSPSASHKPRIVKPPVPARALHVVAAEAYGPAGLADGDNPQSARFAITAKPPLPWQTQWYATANFGLLKHGTGLLLDMGKTVTITSVRIDLSGYRGASLQLRAGRAPTFSDLLVKAHATDAGGVVRLRLASPARARYLLIWFTLLAPNGTGRYQETVYRVVVNGRP